MRRFFAGLITLAMSLFGFVPLAAQANGAPAPMIIELEIVDSDGDGVISGDEGTVGLPFAVNDNTATVNVEVNWGDGVNPTGETITTADIHRFTYSAAGVYQISIKPLDPVGLSHFGWAGTSPKSPGDADSRIALSKFTKVIQWGDIKPTSLNRAFEEWVNLVWVPTDLPTTVTSLGATFAYASSFNHPSVGSWNTSNVTDMSVMFFDAVAFNQDINSWNTSNVTSMQSMFHGASSFNRPLHSWNTSNVTNMVSMFDRASAFNQDLNYNEDTGAWNTSNVTSMRLMFWQALEFNGDISDWNTSSVTDMSRMFEGARSFNQPIGGWNTSNVLFMNAMFQGAWSFNQPIGGWDTSKVTNMEFMFEDAIAFNQPIGGWDTSKVTTMRSMFEDAISFNQPLAGWDTSEVTTMESMFQYARSFNQPLAAGAAAWDTSKVTTFALMFEYAESFNQSLTHFDLSSAIEYAPDLDGTAMEPAKIVALLEQWAAATTLTDLVFYAENIPLPRSVVPTVLILEGRQWNVNVDFEGSGELTVLPSRTFVNGFSGLSADFIGPLIDDVELGETDDAFDTFGELIINDPVAPASVIFDKDSDYVSCERTSDGGQLSNSITDALASEFTVSCITREITLAGATMAFELKAELQGSFIRYSAKVHSLTGTLANNLEIRFGGNLGSDSNTVITKFQDESGRHSLITHDGSRNDDPVMMFQLDQNFTVFEDPTGTEETPATGEDNIYFGLGAKSLVVGQKLFEMEIFFVDYYPFSLSKAAAVQFARGIVDHEDFEFGMCLPVVRDGVAPPLRDECLVHEDVPTPLNFANKDEDNEFVDVGDPSVKGEQYLFENVALHNGNRVDARVTIVDLIDLEDDELEDLDESGDGLLAEWDEWYLAVNTSSSETAVETRVELKIDFLDQQGNAYQFDDLTLNVYDVDENQYVELPAFREYQLAAGTILEVVQGSSGFTRFQETNGVSTSTSTAEPRTISRVTVRYRDISSVTLIMGATLAEDSADFYFDFSAGLGWNSGTNPQGIEPDLVENFVDLPGSNLAPAPYLGPVITSGLQLATPGGQVSYQGRNLASVTAVEVSGIKVPVVATETSLSFLVPAELSAGVVDLVLVSDFGRLSLPGLLRVTGDVAITGVPAVSIKRIGDSARIFAKDVIAAGKVQFFVNGRELAWVRAIDASDPKLRFANNSYYLVRTIDLSQGKNALEIFVAGERVRRVAYTR